MRLTKCPECGGPMEKLATTYVCLNCYHRISDREMLNAAMDRINSLRKIVETQKKDHTENLHTIDLAINAPFFWESDIEPVQLIYGSDGGDDYEALNTEGETGDGDIRG